MYLKSHVSRCIGPVSLLDELCEVVKRYCSLVQNVQPLQSLRAPFTRNISISLHNSEACSHYNSARMKQQLPPLSLPLIQQLPFHSSQFFTPNSVPHFRLPPALSCLSQLISSPRHGSFSTLLTLHIPRHIDLATIHSILFLFIFLSLMIFHSLGRHTAISLPKYPT